MPAFVRSLKLFVVAGVLIACGPESPDTIPQKPGEVVPKNAPPVAVDDSYSVDEDTTLAATISVLANDSDADGKELSAEVVTSPEHGELVLQSDGTFTYVPAPDYYGVDGFTYRVSDQESSSEGVVIIDVIAVNDAPVAAAAAGFVVASDQKHQGSLSATDVDSSVVTFTVTQNPRHGLLTVLASGAFVYSPALGFAGADDFTVQVSDDAGATDAVTVTLGVTAPAGDVATPFSHAFVSGPLPEFACDRNQAFSIVSMTPAAGTLLAANTTYDITAVVQYAVKSTDTIYLEARNDLWVPHPATVDEKVVVQPTAGCAQTSVTLHGVSTSGTQSLEIRLRRGADKLAGSGTTYFVAGSPEIRILGVEHAFSQPVTPDATGEASVRVHVAWKNVPQYWVGDLQAFTPASFFWGSTFTPYPATGSTVIEFKAHLGDCTDEFFVFGAAILDSDWNHGSYDRTHLYFDVPDFMRYYDAMPVQATAATKKNHTLHLRNCSGAPQSITLSTTSSWLFPQTSPAVIAAGGQSNVTYATDAQTLSPGGYSGEIRVYPTNASAFSLPLMLLAGSGAYTVSPATFDWVEEAVGPSHLISKPGEDEDIHSLELPFSLNVFGIPVESIGVSTNGYVSFHEQDTSRIVVNLNRADIRITSGGMYAATVGSAPNRMFVITWDQAGNYADGSITRTGQMVFYEGSDAVLVQYLSVQGGDTYSIKLANGVNETNWTPTAASAFWLMP